MPARILILSAGVGAGHNRAAQAVAGAIRQTDPAAVVEYYDILTLTNALFRRAYGTTYFDMVKHAPHVLGFIYDYLDKPRKPKDPGDRLRLLVERLNLGKFTALLKSQNWNCIVNTHFLPAELIASLRKKRVIQAPQMTVTTDFETHRLWVNQPCERYTTATEEGAAYLSSYGVPREHAQVTGIPVDPVFATARDRKECLALHGLDEKRPVVLQLAGGFGVGPVARLFEAVLSVATPLQAVAVAGKNAKAKKQLESIAVPGRHRAIIHGFTEKIDELMGAADLVVSKPGGLTTSEALARGAAMVIVNPIPGQESRNSDYLLENGAAIKINNLATAKMKLEELLGDPARLKTIQANARRLARPRAAFEVAEIALGLARRGGIRN